MPAKGLLFIPDISGFTRFINETEIEHSRLIIQELLEILISANQLQLEISEIEGDAILFYKYGADPDFTELYQQVAKMFCDFHQHLIAYDNMKYCQCRACTSAIRLNLKVISHYGEFTDYQVRNFRKLIGKDIIVAHQLLKNDIASHDYWLVTSNLLQNDSPTRFADWMKWSNSSKKTETGEISFYYTPLSPLKENITPVTMMPLPLHDKTKLLRVSREYEADIITLFHAVGDFRFRSQWQEGVKAVEEMNHFLPRVGMRCRYLMENGEVNIYSCNYSYQDDRIEFSEADDKGNLTCFFLQQKEGSRTQLDIEYFRKKSLLGPLLFQLTEKKRMEASLNRSMHNLEKVVKEIKLPPLVTVEG